MKIKKNYNIYNELMLILILRLAFENEKLFFALAAVYLISLYLLKNKIIIPKITGINLYIIFVAYATVVGIIRFPMIRVVKDLFYIVPSIIFIFLGYYLCSYKYEKKRLIRTLEIYGILVACIAVVRFILIHSFEFNAIRNAFSMHVYDVGFILPILAFYTLICGECIFSKKVDRIAMTLMLFQIVFSFGRIAILEPLLIFCIICILSMVVLKKQGKTLKIVTVLSVLFLIGFVIMLHIIPQSTIAIFMDKIENSMKEINSSQNIDSIGAALNNWRGYEIKASQRQWMKSDILIKLFGNGLGKGIELEYIPTNWTSDMLYGNEMPIAHNGFYSLLPKGGLIGVLSVILIFVGIFKESIILIKKKDLEKKEIGVILIAITFGAIANMWVVRGLIGNEVFAIWSLFVGWLIAFGRTMRRDSINEKK